MGKHSGSRIPSAASSRVDSIDHSGSRLRQSRRDEVCESCNVWTSPFGNWRVSWRPFAKSLRASSLGSGPAQAEYGKRAKYQALYLLFALPRPWRSKKTCSLLRLPNLWRQREAIACLWLTKRITWAVSLQYVHFTCSIPGTKGTNFFYFLDRQKI